MWLSLLADDDEFASSVVLVLFSRGQQQILSPWHVPMMIIQSQSRKENVFTDKN
jgi:hypothetical protein